MIEIDRREALQGFGAVGATFAIGSYAVAQIGQATPSYLFFTPEEASFVEAAVDRLIPPEPEFPGARAAGVPTYIDLQLAGPFGQGDRLYLAGPITPGRPGQGYQLGLTPAQLYRTSLRVIGEELKRRRIDFSATTDEDKDGFLKDLERGLIDVDGFSSAIFFETLLANTVEGFFADPAYGGNKDMVAWRMIGFPGAYAAYLGIYTKHGIRFEREPLPMAYSGHHDHPHQPAGRPQPSPNDSGASRIPR